MTHFSVLVVGDNVDAQLAPYNEAIEVEPYVDEAFAWEDYEYLDHIRKEGHEVTDALSFLRGYAAWNGTNDMVLGEDGRINRMTRYNRAREILVLCSGGTGSEADQPTGDEVLRQVRDNAASRSVREGEQSTGRAVHVLPTVREGQERITDAGSAMEMVAGSEVRSDPGVVRGADETAGEPLRDLSVLGGGVSGDDASGEDAGAVRSGSLPQDGQPAWASLSEVQLDAWIGKGPHRHSHCGDPVPHDPHVVGTGMYGGAQWDWWVEGGRYANRLYHRNGRKVNSLLKRDLDLKTMRVEARDSAWMRFKQYARIADSFPPPRRWAEIVEAHGEDIEAARREWNTNEFVKAMRGEGYWMDDLHEEFFIGDPAAESKFLDRAESRALSAWAVVKDGKWVERGKMGWFGMSSDEMDEDEWREQVLELVLGLPDDTLLTMIDAHI